uniref:Phosphoprotein n=1 Tax=Beet betanucleorhabdovirus 1 TaxID=3064197 RepID=A0AAT9VVG0_9RHAB
MNPSGSIHPRYAGLPDTAVNSEVMASKYAAEVSKLGVEEDKDFILGAMEEWATHFREEGLTVSNKHLAVFGELSLILQNAGKGDMTGKFAVTISEALKASLLEGRSASISVERLDIISDNFLRGLDGLKKATEAILAAVPRRSVKASRKTRPSPIVKDQDEVHHEKAKERESGESSKGGYEKMEEDPEEPKQAASDVMKEETKDPKAKEPDTAITIEAMKSKVRAHYSDTEFDSFDDHKKITLVYYYIESILGVSKTLIQQDPDMRQMLFDIVDKRRVIRTCNIAKEMALTLADMEEAVDEAADALRACGHIYGKYKGEIIKDGSRPILSVASMISSN